MLLKHVYTILDSVINDGAYANLALKRIPPDTSQKQRAFATALVYETLERLLYIDFIINSVVPKKRPDRQIMTVLRIGVCSLLYMDVTAPKTVNDCVALARAIGKGGQSGFVNAVLRNVSRTRLNPPQLPNDPVERASVELSYPVALVEALAKDYGMSLARQILSAHPRSYTLRIHSDELDGKALERELEAAGIEFKKSELVDSAFRVSSLGVIQESELFKKGLITVESEGSMLSCELLSPKNGDCILDACSAPGGKTAYISRLCNGAAHITAMELHPHRVELVKRTLERLNVKNVDVVCADASLYDEKYAQSFDRALVDAPCSCINASTKPDARYNKTKDTLDLLPKLQLSILSNVSRYVKPGGTLVYSTCTLIKDENEKVVEGFMEQSGDFIPDDFSQELPERLRCRATGGMLTLLPHENDTEGFFIARMKKIC